MSLGKAKADGGQLVALLCAFCARFEPGSDPNRSARKPAGQALAADGLSPFRRPGT
jgi:hypothetical protein